MLAKDVVNSLEQYGFLVANRGRPELDVCQMPSIREVFKEVQPNLLINLAAYTAVDKAELESEKALAVNRDGATMLAEMCQISGIPMIHLSSDYVFDGKSNHPYKECDIAGPCLLYTSPSPRDRQK